jgi:hypothetical protein
MSLSDFLASDKPLALLSGVAGAAAMAATDWRSPLRLVQHLFVGTSASAIATPVFAPAISKILGFLAVDPAAHANASAFIVGAFAIYVLEFSLAFWRAKTRRADADKIDGNDR